MAEICKSLFF